ncbi:MAG: carboxypeptidase-like regulatory domain-containing protein [Bacteroidetes bacterium]|nr:carboxypeptidase-like regulatory domain-containing protein [Bacteroidota bacterium]
MKKSITLSVPQTCAEQWSNFTPTSQGGWCGSCKKEVVDFTAMSDQQIIDYFSKSTAHTCGRFQASQLKTYSTMAPVSVRPEWMFLKAGMLGLFLALLPTPSSALPPITKIESSHHFMGLVDITSRQAWPQPVVHVTGKIISEEERLPMVGVNIALKGTTLGAVSNEKGEFVFERELREGDVLVFSFIGYKTFEHTVSAASTTISVVMQLDFETILGEVVVGKVYVEPPATGFQKWWVKFKNIF